MHIFTLDIDGNPTLCLNAVDANEAIGICSLDELRADLSTLTAGGNAVCTSDSVLVVRNASDDDVAAFWKATSVMPAVGSPTFVFLIEIDEVRLEAKTGLIAGNLAADRISTSKRI